jgi:hypothetical protein
LCHGDGARERQRQQRTCASAEQAYEGHRLSPLCGKPSL